MSRTIRKPQLEMYWGWRDKEDVKYGYHGDHNMHPKERPGASVNQRHGFVVSEGWDDWKNKNAKWLRRRAQRRANKCLIRAELLDLEIEGRYLMGRLYDYYEQEALYHDQ